MEKVQQKEGYCDIFYKVTQNQEGTVSINLAIDIRKLTWINVLK